MALKNHHLFTLMVNLNLQVSISTKIAACFRRVGLMKIVLWLLHPDPRSRATLTDLATDKWVNQEINLSLYSFQSVMQGTWVGCTCTSERTVRVVWVI